MAFIQTSRDKRLYLADAGGVAAKSYVDATGTTINMTGSNYIEVYPTVGDLQVNVPRRDATPQYHRGTIIDYTVGDDQPITGSFTCKLNDQTVAASAKLYQLHASRGTGYIFANWTSDDMSTGAPQAIANEMLFMLVEVTERTDRGDASDHVRVLRHCRITANTAEAMDGDTLSFDFTSYAPDVYTNM